MARSLNNLNRRELLECGLKAGVICVSGLALAPSALLSAPVAHADEVNDDIAVETAARFANMSVEEVAAIARVEEDGWWGQATTTALTLYFRGVNYGYVNHQYYPNVSQNSALTSGWNCDNTLAGDPLIKKNQFFFNNNVTDDGLIGPGTISALQMRMGTYIDGNLSGPSPCIREMQRRLNAGTF